MTAEKTTGQCRRHEALFKTQHAGHNHESKSTSKVVYVWNDKYNTTRYKNASAINQSINQSCNQSNVASTWLLCSQHLPNNITK